MARQREKQKARRVTLPGMSGVEGRTLVSEGQYAVRVSEVTQEEGSVAPYLKWKFEITSKQHKGASLFYNTSLATPALWNLKTLLEALGYDIPEDDMEVDADDLSGLECMVSVEHDTWEGKKQAKIVDFWSSGASKADDDEEEEDEPPVKKGKAKKAEPVEDEEEDDEPKAKRGKKAAPVEDDEDEEDEAPPAKSERNSRRREKRAEKKSKKEMLKQDDLSDMSQDELEEVAEKYGFDIDFSELPSLRKMRNAVIDAAEGAGVLEE